MRMHHVKPAVADQTTHFAVGARIVGRRDLTDEMRQVHERYVVRFEPPLHRASEL